MRVFVTGASGFIGRRVVPLLGGHEVLCLSRRPAATADSTARRTLVGDLGRPEEWRRALEDFKPEWCVHLAWEGLPDYSLSRCRLNLDAGLGLLQLLTDVGIQRIVVAGSCFEYGRVSGRVAEDAAPVEASVFASTKRAYHAILESVSRSSRFEYRWARVFFAYGPGQRTGSLIPHLGSAYAAGQLPQVREPQAAQDFVYVDDVASALVALAQCDGPSGIFNVGSGHPTTVGDVANRVARAFGATPPYDLSAELSGFWADQDRTFAATGWRAGTDIEDGIIRTLAALKDGA